MQGERDDGSRVKIPVPDGFDEGVNVRIKGSNIAFDRYPELLRRAAIEIGVAGKYFEEPTSSATSRTPSATSESTGTPAARTWA